MIQDVQNYSAYYCRCYSDIEIHEEMLGDKIRTTAYRLYQYF